MLRAPQNDARLLVRVTVEMLRRTGLRVSEYTGPRAGAVVQIGAGPWLHVPVGKLREDRYLPLHPHLVALIDDYRRAHVDPSHPLLLPRENGRALDRHTVTWMINKAGAAAGLPHIHPHQLRHTLATSYRGMSLEAIAAMLGHYAQPGHDPALRQREKIASRTVADEYFAVTGKVGALYGQDPVLPAGARRRADPLGPAGRARHRCGLPLRRRDRDGARCPAAHPTREGKVYLSVTWNPSAKGSVGRRPSSPARIPT